MSKVKLKKLVGKHMLSGVAMGYTKHDAECVKFILDGKVYVATEDPEDGYRSCMKSLELSNEKMSPNFPDTEVDVVFQNDENAELCHFIATQNGNEVLTIGTDYTDAYYTVCVFRYLPENLPCNKRKIRR